MLFHIIFSSLLNGLTDMFDIVLEDMGHNKSKKFLPHNKFKFDC
jgi:hypothetical protein